MPRKTSGAAFIEKVIKMPLVNINTVMKEHYRGAPDSLSIDTEGIDGEILKSIDFTHFRPNVLCVETLVFGTPHVETKILELMKSNDYAIRGSTFVNTIFVDSTLLLSRFPTSGE
jgi:hypothetical protein